MEFVRNLARDKQIVKLLRAEIKSEIVLRAAIEINFHARELWPLAHNRKRAFALPIFRVEGNAKRLAEHPREPVLLRLGKICARRLLDQRRAVRAHRSE